MILRLLAGPLNASQREIAEEHSVSLGAVNFCVKALIDKRSIKLARFNASTNKLGKVCVLPSTGLVHRAQLAAGLIKSKMAKFEAIRVELEQLRGIFDET